MNCQKIFCDSFVDNWDSNAITSYETGLTLSYGGLANRVQRVCLYLEMLGVQPGTHIGIVGNNSIDWVTNYMATILHGAVAVTIQVTYDAREMLSLLSTTDIEILFIDSGLVNDISDLTAIQSLQFVLSQDMEQVLFCRDEKYSSGAEKLRMLDMHFLSMYPSGFQPSDMYAHKSSPNESMAIFFTAGTLGEPKPLVLTSDNMEGNIIFGIKKSLFPRDSKTLTSSSMGNVWGTVFNMLVPLASGSHLYVFDKFYNSEELIKAFKRVRPKRIILSPMQLRFSYELVYRELTASRFYKILKPFAPLTNRLLYRAIKHAYHRAMGGNCQEVIVGSTNISRSLKNKLYKVGIRFTISYGMTECGGLVCYTPCSESVPNTVGKSFNKMIKCRVRPIELKGMPDNAGGIEVQGMTVMKEYYKDREATREAFTADNWFITRDIGTIDSDNNVRIIGRIDTMIERPEGTIIPERLESRLIDYTEVIRSVIVDRDGELTAVIQPDFNYVDRNNVNEIIAKVIERLNSEIPAYMAIKKFEVSEQLELTLKGTVARYKYF